MPKRSNITVLFFLLPVMLSAQGIPYDSAFLTVAAKNALASYQKLLRSYDQLYSGSEYIRYSKLGKEHPYFKMDDFTPERIIYNGNEYADVEILYDLQLNEVILFDGKMIKLMPEKIDCFTKSGHLFLRLDQPGIPTGFYDLLYSGEIKVLVKRSKILFEEKRTDKEIIREFKEFNDYYIFKSGVYYSVKSKKSVLQLYADKKKQIKQYLRQNAILFNQERELAMVKMTEYYTILSAQ